MKTTQLNERKPISSNCLSKPVKNWYIFYTYPRAERAVLKDLVEKGYEAYLPTIRKMRVWRNRQRKYIDEILFPNYIFVYAYERELCSISRLPRVVTFIHCGGKPSIIKIKDIEAIKSMLAHNDEVSIKKDFCDGENVRIIYGPLTGYSGLLIRQNGKTKFGIKIKDINHMILIDVCANCLERVSALA